MDMHALCMFYFLEKLNRNLSLTHTHTNTNTRTHTDTQPSKKYSFVHLPVFKQNNTLLLGFLSPWSLNCFVHCCFWCNLVCEIEPYSKLQLLDSQTSEGASGTLSLIGTTGNLLSDSKPFAQSHKHNKKNDFLFNRWTAEPQTLSFMLLNSEWTNPRHSRGHTGMNFLVNDVAVALTDCFRWVKYHLIHWTLDSCHSPARLQPDWSVFTYQQINNPHWSATRKRYSLTT